MQQIQAFSDRLVREIEKVVFGKRQAIRWVIVGLLSEGHLLIEDVPGTAKTLLAKAMARAIGGRFARLQCTPDLLPSEVTGSNVYRPDTQQFAFFPGPVFSNVLLADEINRATPRTQAALLEAMAERQVSIEGATRPLPAPFFVLATQNPVEHEGTFPLPEAQLDRFLMRISIGYPSPEAEEKMLVEDVADPLESVERVAEPEQLRAAQQLVRRVGVAPEIRRYIVDLVAATRDNSLFTLGAGPRATKSLYRSCQALAAMDGREFVTPDDVKALHTRVLAHRLILAPAARLGRKKIDKAIEEVVRLVPVPLVRDPSSLRARPSGAAAGERARDQAPDSNGASVQRDDVGDSTKGSGAVARESRARPRMVRLDDEDER